MTTATPTAGALEVALEQIHVPVNVRDLDVDHVDALTESIRLIGQQQPALVVRGTVEQISDGVDYELIAGFHRYAAVSKLADRGLLVVVRERDADQNGADMATSRAAENITRKQLNAYEEAVAVKAMLDKGLTEHGAAQALGWAPARVTARLKLLELPEKAQKMIGAGELPLSLVEPLRQIGQVSAEVLNLAIDFVEQQPEYADSLVHDPARLIQHAVRDAGSKTDVIALVRVGSYDVEQLKLGKKANAEYEQACELYKKVNPYYGSLDVRFTDAEVDQARAAGVLIEAAGTPLIVDRSLYRELVKQAIHRSLTDCEAQAAEVAEQRAQEQQQLKQERALDPEATARRDHGRRTRAIAQAAHGANTDLGWQLRNELACVDPGDINVARFFVYSLLGEGPSWGDSDSDLVTRLATTGVRLVVPEFRTDVTKTRKDGSKGALRIDYGKPSDSAAARQWLWKFIDGAKTAGDLYGRALVLIAAEQYASRLVLPGSQAHPPQGWRSHNDIAKKALGKLAGPHLPVTLKQLEKAIAKAKKQYDAELTAARESTRAARSTPASVADVDGDLDETFGDAGDVYELNDKPAATVPTATSRSTASLSPRPAWSTSPTSR